MDLPGLIWRGAPLDDVALLETLPPELAQVLAQRNGFVAWRGGLHLRGACTAPAWHALRAALDGPAALSRVCPELRPGDLPFAESGLGEQYVLRERAVWRFSPGSALEPSGWGVGEFLDRAIREPVETLRLDPLLDWLTAGGTLRPGELLVPGPEGLHPAPALAWRGGETG